jgi:hypothetical protein
MSVSSNQVRQSSQCRHDLGKAQPMELADHGNLRQRTVAIPN